MRSTRDFTRELNIIWDLWTIDAFWSGGIAAQDDLKNDSINTMKIDWVHTYKLVSDGTTNIEEGESASLEVDIFPNPTTDKLNIHLLNPPKKDANVFIYNKIGQVVKSEAILRNTAQISMNGLSPDLYFVKVLNGGETGWKKVVKE